MSVNFSMTKLGSYFDLFLASWLYTSQMVRLLIESDSKWCIYLGVAVGLMSI